MEPLAALIRQRASLTSALTRLNTYFSLISSKEAISDDDLEELEFRLETNKTLLEKYSNIHNNILLISSDKQHDFDLENFENMFYGVATKIRRFIKKNKPTDIGSKTQNMPIKGLPSQCSHLPDDWVEINKDIYELSKQASENAILLESLDTKTSTVLSSISESKYETVTKLNDSYKLIRNMILNLSRNIIALREEWKSQKRSHQLFTNQIGDLCPKITALLERNDICCHKCTSEIKVDTSQHNKDANELWKCSAEEFITFTTLSLPGPSPTDLHILKTLYEKDIYFDYKNYFLDFNLKNYDLIKTYQPLLKRGDIAGAMDAIRSWYRSHTSSHGIDDILDQILW